MFRRSTRPILLLSSLALLFAPTAALAEAGFAPAGGKASASLDFRIIIPPIMRVLENSHPTELQADASGALSGQQRLVVMSNLKRGFCIHLRQPPQQVPGWRLHNASETTGTTLVPVADGFRLCTARAGRYTLLLQHEFGNTSSTGVQTAMRWPVQTDLSTL